jgi:cyanophycinase
MQQTIHIASRFHRKKRMLGSLFRSCGARLAVPLAIFALCQTAPAGERLMLIGGGARPAEAMRRFVAWSGATRARILIVSWASEEPQASADAVARELTPHRPAEIVVAPFPPLDDAKRARFLDQLAAATGVFFTGGDQRRILDTLDAHLTDALRRRYRDGVAFGGTSAGTAVMSERCLTGDGDFSVIDGTKVETRPGIGVLPGVILDQHFIRRQRQNRLFGLVLQSPTTLGVGIDEDTAALVTDNRILEVVGQSQVMTVEARAQTGALVVRVLKPGQRFDLRRRTLRKATGRL